MNLWENSTEAKFVTHQYFFCLLTNENLKKFHYCYGLPIASTPHGRLTTQNTIIKNIVPSATYDCCSMVNENHNGSTDINRLFKKIS